MHQSILIVILLVWAFDFNTNVISLIFFQNCELGIKGIQVKPSHFLVKHLRQFMDACLVFLIIPVFPKQELGQSLVAERSRHHE